MEVFLMALKVDLAVILGSILGNLSDYLSCAFNKNMKNFKGLKIKSKINILKTYF
jgi:hypothetical protein